MKIHSVSFEAWLGGHPPEHDDRLCREVYPWAVFERLDYTKRMRNRVQETGLGSERFFATVIDCKPGRENRLIFKIRLETPRDENPKWWNGVWSDLFHLIVEPDGRFVTLYTKKDDPSKSSSRILCGVTFRVLRRSACKFQQDEARGEQDPDRARELQVEIDKATAQREEIRPWAPS
jgi:hypothetical protein